MATLHKQFKSDFWENEIELVKQGKGTRNWTVDEQIEMLRKGYVKGYEIQHMCSKSKYPHLACDISNGQALKFVEHRAKGIGIHSIMGGTQNPLHGYVNEYDFPNLKLYEFSSAGVDKGHPPITYLIELCPDVIKEGHYDSNWEDAFEELVPGFKSLNPNQKTMIQRLEGLRQQSKSSLSFKEFVLENSMNHSSSEFSYLSELSWRVVDHIDMDSFDIASKYKDLLKVSDLDEVTGKRLKQLIYQLEVKKVDPKSMAQS